MRILLTGKNGQVGFELQRSMAILGDVMAVGRSECDLSDSESIRRLVKECRPDVIVNTAAYTAVDKAEEEGAVAHAVNTVAPGVLAEEAELLGATLVHFSTDYVFDGLKKAPYIEQDQPNPQSVYGVTKLNGERLVQDRCTRHLVLRTSWVVGAHGGNFAKTMLRLASERDELYVVADQFGVPCSAAMLADLTAHLVRQALIDTRDFPYGLYHAVATGVTNWYEYACYVIERARALGKEVRVSQNSIHPIMTVDYPTPAKRPLNSRLDNSKLRNTFGLRLPNWEEGVDFILDQILEH